ncbi:unnamed protein product [Camellia sinensis]
MEMLSMDSANLTGLIPSSICNISSLMELNLHNNNLFGSLPRDMCSRHSSLQIMYLEINKLTGNIPRAIGNYTLLSVFRIKENNLIGEIPQELGSLDSLEFLAIESANLTGLIPSSIYNSSSLKELHLQRNKLTGNSPRAIDNCTLLSVLHLGENNLTGLIPKQIGELPNVRELRLCTNNLMAAIPTSIFNNSSLQVMSLTENNLSSNLPSSIGLWLPNLSFLLLPTNKLTGIIPESISNASKLIALDLSNNSFAGSILKSLGNLRLLKYLHLDGNNLMSGSSSSSSELSFLTSLVNCKDFKKLLINRNPLDNILPTTIGNLSASLEEFKVDSCGIKGNIPSEIGNISNLAFLYMQQNVLTGFIPSTIKALGKLQILDLSNNKLQGSIPDDICQLKNMGDLRLNQNEPFGLILECLGNITSLRQNLKILYLSYNDLSDVIPKSLETQSHLSSLNFSFNKLRGQIPNKGPFANFTIQSFMSNEALCGAPKFQVPPCHTSSFHHLREKRVALALYILLPTASVLLATTFVFLFIKCRRRNKTPSNVDVLPRITPPRITYQQLFRATNGFSKSNLLGMGSFGSIYKAIVEDTTVLAIKVFNLQVKGAFKSFEVECEIMRHIRHRNLTKVISSCSNLDFKALVLEYMPNGSLEKWLYSYNCFLDMLQRLDIMIDVACALEYLHTDYSMPLVHCDLKPINILLDSDMVAHVSDFGIAKLLDLGESVRHTMTIATFGYIAPEFGLEGLISTACDVHSYGILLMETFTRVKPTDEMFFEDMTMRRWIRESLPNAISHVIDANLLKPEEEHLTAVCIIHRGIGFKLLCRII